MTFHSLVGKVKKHKLLGDDHRAYKDLHDLRKLRNRIHLQMVERKLDTDYWEFGAVQRELVKRALWAILNSESLKGSSDLLDELGYLQPSEDSATT